MKKIKLSTKEVEHLSNASSYQFPKYTSQIINWANQNAQGTRAKVVGQIGKFDVFGPREAASADPLNIN